MSIVNTNQLFPEDHDSNWAVGHFNVHNHEFIRAVIEATEIERAPAILAIGMGSIKYMGMSSLVSAARDMAEQSETPLAIHLDHARELDTVKEALDLGFTSVMIDGSSRPYGENVQITRQVVEMAHTAGASAEGEIGVLPPDLTDINKKLFTSPKTAVQFARDTGVDFLAVSVGSVHGMQTQGASLDIALLSQLNDELDCPMVLHGASGVIDHDIQEAISNGVRKINVNTHLKVVFKRFLIESYQLDQSKDFLVDLRGGINCVRDAVQERIQVFGATGKA